MSAVPTSNLLLFKATLTHTHATHTAKTLRPQRRVSVAIHFAGLGARMPLECQGGGLHSSHERLRKDLSLLQDVC